MPSMFVCLECRQHSHIPCRQVCNEHEMQEAQTFTHSLNVWMVMLVSVLWMTLLIWGAELLKNCGGVHEHGHGHDDHGHGMSASQPPFSLCCACMSLTWCQRRPCLLGSECFASLRVVSSSGCHVTCVSKLCLWCHEMQVTARGMAKRPKHTSPTGPSRPGMGAIEQGMEQLSTGHVVHAMLVLAFNSRQAQGSLQTRCIHVVAWEPQDLKPENSQLVFRRALLPRIMLECPTTY